jgi:membrane protease YdiL (CAAX protease family)
MEQAESQPKKIISNKFGWGPLAALLITLAAYVFSQLILIFPLVIVQANSESGSNLLDTPWFGLVLSGLSASALLFVLWVYLKKKKLSLKSLGFVKIKASDFGWTMLAALGYIFAVGIISWLAGNIPGFNPDQAQEIGYKSAQGWQLALAFIGLVIIPPIAEEMLFRGFLYRGLANNKWNQWLILSFTVGIALIAGLTTGSWVAPVIILAIGVVSAILGIKFLRFGAAIFTSMIFGIVHMQWNVALDVFVLSIVLIMLFEKTKNLWSCIFLHGIKNGLAFMFLFVFLA